MGEREWEGEGGRGRKGERKSLYPTVKYFPRPCSMPTLSTPTNQIKPTFLCLLTKE
jgi:hypothetical protein